MRKISNIRLKDRNTAKLDAIKGLRSQFNLGLQDSYWLVDDLLKKGEIVAVGNRYSSIESVNESADFFEAILRLYFEFDLYVEDLFEMEDIKPDAQTKLALDWYGNLDEETKEKIKLVGQWLFTPLAPYGKSLKEHF